jgi:kinesin family protein 18/19
MASTPLELDVGFDEHGAAGEHMKAMWAGQSNVLVATRVRPLMKHDVIKRSCVRAMDGNMIVIMDPASGDKQDVLRANRSREKQYAFDHVFDGNSSQQFVYNSTTKFLIHGVLDGYNATVFAYGQTGSGKTYTMIGTQQDPGIMVRVMSDLFIHSAQQGKQQGVTYKVVVSFLEVYNENIRDLLGDAEEYLDLREDPIKGPVVAGITEVEASSGDEIMNLLHQGNAKRSQAATAANEVSSRSHAVLQVLVEGRDRAPGVVANIKVGKLSLVDLAGSERAANTKNTGARLVEGANINRSLLALGNCINALGEKGNKGNFVPYRDSKLTRLLKDSLGGNCRTVMIANISSAESSFEETLNTLKYANRAKNIKTNVQRNVLNVNYHISEYVQLINNLRGEIKVLKDQISLNNVHQMDDGGFMPAVAPHSPFPNSRHAVKSPNATHVSANMRQPSTPLQILRESLRSGAALNNGANNEGRELVNNMRKRIVDNFQERMQLRRSLIELEDQNVQNSIEVSKRQLMVVQWTDQQGKMGHTFSPDEETFAEEIVQKAPGHIKEAWTECEQIRKAISKNNGMKKNIAKRLRLNEKEAESFRDELSNKITGEDRLELMELQYQVGRLELENMELEQHRIVHESIVKGKDLIIQKLKLQLAVKDKLISHQQRILVENGLQNKIGHSQMLLLEQTVMGDVELGSTMAPPSPPRNIQDLHANNNSNQLAGQFNFNNIPFATNVSGKNSPQKLSQLNIGALNAANAANFDMGNNNIPLSSRSQNDVDDLKADLAHRELRGNNGPAKPSSNINNKGGSNVKASNNNNNDALNDYQDGDWEEYSEFSDNEEYEEDNIGDQSPKHGLNVGRNNNAQGTNQNAGNSGVKKGSNNAASSNSNSSKTTDNMPIGVLEGRGFGPKGKGPSVSPAPVALNMNSNANSNAGNAPARGGRHYRATVDEYPSYTSAESKQPLRPLAQQQQQPNQQRRYQSYPDYAPPNNNNEGVDGNYYSDESDNQSYNNPNSHFNKDKAQAQPKLAKVGAGNNYRDNKDVKQGDTKDSKDSKDTKDSKDYFSLNGEKKMYSKVQSAEKFELFRDNSDKGKIGSIFGNNVNTNQANNNNIPDLKLQLRTRQDQLQAQQRAQQQQYEQLYLSPGRGERGGGGFKNAMIFPSDGSSAGKEKEKEKLLAGRSNSNSKQSNSNLKDEYNFDDFRIQGIGQSSSNSNADHNNNERKLRLQQHLQLDYNDNNNANYLDDSFESAQDNDRKMPQIRQAGLSNVAGNNMNNANAALANKNIAVLSKLKTKMAGGSVATGAGNAGVGINNSNVGAANLNLGGVSALILPSAGPAAMSGLDMAPSQPLLGPVGGGIGGVGRPNNNLKAGNNRYVLRTTVTMP